VTLDEDATNNALTPWLARMETRGGRGMTVLVFHSPHKFDDLVTWYRLHALGWTERHSRWYSRSEGMERPAEFYKGPRDLILAELPQFPNHVVMLVDPPQPAHRRKPQ